MLQKGLRCGRLRGKSSTFPMSREGVNSGLKRYQVVRAKGDWCPEILSVCSSTDRAAFSCQAAVCTRWD